MFKITMLAAEAAPEEGRVILPATDILAIIGAGIAAILIVALLGYFIYKISQKTKNSIIRLQDDPKKAFFSEHGELFEEDDKDVVVIYKDRKGPKIKTVIGSVGNEVKKTAEELGDKAKDELEKGANEVGTFIANEGKKEAKKAYGKLSKAIKKLPEKIKNITSNKLSSGDDVNKTAGASGLSGLVQKVKKVLKKDEEEEKAKPFVPVGDPLPNNNGQDIEDGDDGYLSERDDTQPKEKEQSEIHEKAGKNTASNEAAEDDGYLYEDYEPNKEHKSTDKHSETKQRKEEHGKADKNTASNREEVDDSYLYEDYDPNKKHRSTDKSSEAKQQRESRGKTGKDDYSGSGKDDDSMYIVAEDDSYLYDTDSDD